MGSPLFILVDISTPTRISKGTVLSRHYSSEAAHKALRKRTLNKGTPMAVYYTDQKQKIGEHYYG